MSLFFFPSRSLNAVLPIRRWPHWHGLHSRGLCHHHHLLQPDGDVQGGEAAGRADGGRRRWRQRPDEGRTHAGRRRVWPAEGRGAGVWRGGWSNNIERRPWKLLSFIIVILVFLWPCTVSIGLLFIKKKRSSKGKKRWDCFVFWAQCSGETVGSAQLFAA